MYGALPDYPGEVIETAPDGRLFIVRHEDDGFIRVREVIHYDKAEKNLPHWIERTFPEGLQDYLDRNPYQ